MVLRIRDDSFIKYLRSRADTAEQVPRRDPDGLCILSGQILRRNLKEFLDREGIPTTPLADFTTIEGLAGTLLQSTDEPSQILSEGIRDRLLEEILAQFDPHQGVGVQQFSNVDLRSFEEKALTALAERLPYSESETRETLSAELDDYYRWTNATSDVAPAVRELSSVDNRFAQLQTNRSMDAFRGIERLITARLDELDVDRQQSRSHLVRAAGENISGHCESLFGEVEWIAVAGISVFDNPTLRFLEGIAAEPDAPDVEVFTGEGTKEYNAKRVDALRTESEVRDAKRRMPELDSDAATTLLEATAASPSGVPENATLVEAPTDQRAVEHIAAEVRELVQNGTHPREILIVAPDAGSYQSLVEQAFETVEIPVHVETRRPYANIPAYRCFRTFVDVIHSVATGEPLTYDELVDPLRLGYCPRGGHGEQWPIEGRAFTKVEQELHRKQQYHNRGPDRYEDQGIDFSVWRERIDEIPDWTGPWYAVEEYLDDIESLATEPPTTGDGIVDLFSSYLGTYVFQTVGHDRSLYTGPAIDTTRTTLSDVHPTSEAERVRGALDEVGTHYDRVQALFDVPVSWDEIGRAFSAVLGGNSYGKPHIDQYAVPTVDAGNAYFREAEHLFILGMNAGEFPGAASTPTFLHGDVRQLAYETALSGEAPYHHLDSRGSEYGEALDFYQATLATASPSAEIRLYHTYRDERGNEISWSPFLDVFDTETEDDESRPIDRISAGDWLPQPRSSDESWDDLASRIAPRERLRVLLYQAHREHPDDEPPVAVLDIEDILDTLSSKPLEDLILPRVDRQHEPPTAVEINPGEPAFAETDLEAITGGPHHPHELDLQAQCGLKYYYYQFLYNYTGSDPEREEIPKYYASNPHWRLGELPYIVRENYADPRYVEKWRTIVTTLLPERQSDTVGLNQFDSEADIREWVEQEDTFDSYDLNTILPNLHGEWQLVQEELAEGITRTWQWREGGAVNIGGHELNVPAYRHDKVSSGESEYSVPIFFTRFSDRAMSALKSCFDGAIWQEDERTNELCLNCGQSDRCRYHSKYVIDHRMLAGYQHESEIHESKVVGIGLQEQYAGPSDGKRVLAVQNNYTEIVQPADGGFERLVPRGFPQNWGGSVENWSENFTELATVRDTDRSVRLEANPTIVNQDECLDCVYRDLCFVPDSEVTLE